MENKNLSLNLTAPGISAGLVLAIVQDEWLEKSGAGFEDWAAENDYQLTLYNFMTLTDRYFSKCDENGCIVAGLRVYRSGDLNYQLVASYGELSSAKVVDNELHSESVDVSLADSYTIDFGEIVSAEWDGGVWAADGTGLSVKPAIITNGNTASWGQKLEGTLRITSKRSYHAYDLTISPRDASADEQAGGGFDPKKLYDSTVRAFYVGGVEKHTVDLPDMSDVQCESGYTGSGGEVVVDPEEGEDGGGQVYMVDVSAFDYCNEGKIEGADVWIDGTIVTAWPVQLAAGEHTIKVHAAGYTDSDADDLTENDTFTL